MGYRCKIEMYHNNHLIAFIKNQSKTKWKKRNLVFHIMRYIYLLSLGSLPIMLVAGLLLHTLAFASVATATDSCKFNTPWPQLSGIIIMSPGIWELWSESYEVRVVKWMSLLLYVWDFKWNGRYEMSKLVSHCHESFYCM